MKKIMLSVLVATLIATSSQAQEIPDRKAPRHEMQKKHHRGDEFKQLNLSEEQKTKLKAVNEENRKQMEELKKNDNITVKEWKVKMEAQRKEHQSNLQALLSEDQKAQLEKSRQEKKTTFRERSKNRHNRIGNMKADLGLSDEQSAKLKSNREAMAAKIKAVREDKSLTDENKKEQAKELMKKQREEMKSILTEEQLKKMEEQKQQRHSRRKSA